MNRYLNVWGLVLIFSMLICSCNDDKGDDDPNQPPIPPPDGTKYLLKKIVEMENETDVDGEYFFSYDEQNRPTEIICQWFDGGISGTGKLIRDSWTFTYQNRKVTELIKNHDDKGGAYEIIEYQYTLDDRGRIHSWECEDTYNDQISNSKGSFIFGNDDEILREESSYGVDDKNYSYAEWAGGNKVKVGFGYTHDIENNRTDYDILTYTTYLNNAAINVDLNVFLHDSEAGVTFAADSYLKMFGNYLGIRSKNYLKSFEEHYSFNTGAADLTTLQYEFDAQTGLPVKISVAKQWSVNGRVDTDMDYYILEYEPVK